MLKITNVLNPLTGGATSEEYKWRKGASIADYIDYSGECVVACNGEILDLAADKIFPANGEDYMVMPAIENMDRQSQRLLGYTAMSVVRFFPGWGPMAAFIGSNAINLFLRDEDKAQSTSESYAWQHRDSPTAAQGSAMPVIYGKARVRPVLKNRYVTVEGDEQRLYALYGLAAHKVDQRESVPTLADAIAGTVGPSEEFTHPLIPGATLIYPQEYRGPTNTIARGVFLSERPFGKGMGAFYNDIFINGRPIGDYNADVEWETRQGLPEQLLILGFDVTYANTAFDISLYLDYPTIVKTVANFELDTDTMLVHWAEHYLTFQGVEYKILEGTYLLTGLAGKTAYIIWDTAISTSEYQTAAGTIVLPNTAYIIFQFNVTATNWGARIYPYRVTSPSSGDWTTLASASNPVTNAHNIEVTFEFPSGLFGHIPGTDLVPARCRLFAQYREVGATTWTNFASGFGKPDYVDSGDPPAVVITRKRARMFNVVLKTLAPNFTLDYTASYEVRVTASSTAVVKIVNIATVYYGVENADGTPPGFTYPGEPLLGIKALASGQISGDLDVQVDVERSNVWVWNTNVIAADKWVLGDANNHAWAVYDILAQGHPDHPAYPTFGNEDAEAIYGCGVDKNRLDYDSFKVWATNIEDMEYELNIVFDTFMPAWDAILRICQEGRGMVYPVGTKIFAFTDKATDVTQVFTMGNIHAGTFVQRYMESKQKVNMVEANYYDQERNYEKTVIAARSEDWDSTSGQSIPTTVTLYGTTTIEQAWSIIRFILRGNELLNNVITFGVDIDALAAQAGDVVEVQHDVLNAGRGGRIVSYEENPVVNPSFESGTEGSFTGWLGGSKINSWDLWSDPGNAQRRWSTDQAYAGDRSYYHISAIFTAGISQVITGLSPSTVYTVTCWIYPVAYTSLRLAIETDTFYTDHPESTGAWERLMVTVTTTPGQTTLRVLIGGEGTAYFDAVQVEAVSVATEFMQQARVTLDRDVTLSPASSYDLVVWRSGTRIVKSTALNLGETRDNILYATPWDVPPQQYDPYSFGTATTVVEKYRITNISRTEELMRTLTLVQYDEDLYNSYVPSDVEPAWTEGFAGKPRILPPVANIEELAALLNIATNVQLREVVSRNRQTGQYESSIVVTWVPVDGDPRGAWEVWFRDVDASDDDWDGTWGAAKAAVGYELDQKVEFGGKAYISLEDDNTSTPFNQ